MGYFFEVEIFRIAVSRKRLQLDSKTDLPRTRYFLEFFVGTSLISSISYLHGLKSARIAQILLFLDDIKSFR